MKRHYFLRVLTFNVLAPLWSDSSWYEERGVVKDLLDVEARLPLIAQTIEMFAGDIVLLQEVESDTLARLHQLLDNSYHFLPLVSHREGLWRECLPDRASWRPNGNAILVKIGVEEEGTLQQDDPIPISEDGNMAARAHFVLKTCGVMVRVWNTHLEGGNDDVTDEVTADREAAKRDAQVREVLRHIHERGAPEEEILIWGGDWNAPFHTLTHVFEQDATFDVTDHTTPVIRHRTEFDENMHLYSGPIDVIVCAGNHKPMTVHSFARPPLDATLAQHLEFLLTTYGSDHMPVGLTIATTATE